MINPASPWLIFTLGIIAGIFIGEFLEYATREMLKKSKRKRKKKKSVPTQ